MTTQHSIVFGKLRSFLWPIRQQEIKKFFPLFLLYTLICFNYSLLKAAKDALIITAPGSGAAAIPFIKVWVIVPVAILVLYLLTQLFHRFSQEKVFYIMIGGFLAFFLSFALILYPLRHLIHPYHLADRLQEFLPVGFSGLVAIFRNWSFVLFYVMADLWSSVIMSVLFWGFASGVVDIEDAKRFYGILGVGANIGTILAGQISVILSGNFLRTSSIFGEDCWGQSLSLMTAVVLVVGGMTIVLFRWYHVKVIYQDSELKSSFAHHKNKSVKTKLRKNFSLLKRSKYLVSLSVLVISFNIVMNMIEIIWKDRIKMLYPHPNDFNGYMGKVLMATGILSTLIGFFVCGNMIRRLKWTLSALITPVTILITGSLFFGMIFLQDIGYLSTQIIIFGFSPLMLEVLFGTIQNILSRTCKFTLFDATKEMAFIPLNIRARMKGKAAIDGLGSRLGKSGGSVIHQGFLMVFGTLSLATPFVVVFVSVVISVWGVSIYSLGRRFEMLTSQKGTLEIDDLGRESAIFQTQRGKGAHTTVS